MCFLIGSWFISQSFNTSTEEQTTTSKENFKNFRYELISPNENNIIIFDKQTGESWRKFIPSNEGPTNWEKQKSPISKSSN